jgi:hypothetical protein
MYAVKPVDGGRVYDLEVGYLETCQGIFFDIRSLNGSGLLLCRDERWKSLTACFLFG